jgi:hypothetical protein
MRAVTVYTTDKAYNFFVELVKSLQFVKKIETDRKQNLLDNIKTGLEEVRMFNKGELETTPAKDFLDEL